MKHGYSSETNRSKKRCSTDRGSIKALRWLTRYSINTNNARHRPNSGCAHYSPRLVSEATRPSRRRRWQHHRGEALMPKARSAGSSKVVHSQAPKTEPKANAINPGGAAQLGSKALAPKYATPLEAGRGYSPPVGPSNNLGVGPGAGRTVMKSGSQGTHGSPAQGEAGMQGGPDRGPRAILGPPGSKP